MGSVIANFSERRKDTLPAKGKSHTTPESAPGAGDLKPTCDDLAFSVAGQRGRKGGPQKGEVLRCCSTKQIKIEPSPECS